jgi:hypothetical protein
MQQAQTKEGVHQLNQDNSIPEDVVRIMKTQDLGYTITKKNQDDKVGSSALSSVI